MNDAYSKIFLCLPELSEIELETLAEACQERAEKKRKARREGLRQELMINLQKAIGDILHNGFNLAIKNTKCDPEYDDYVEVFFEPEDTYSIVMVDTKQRQRYFFLISHKLNHTYILIHQHLTSKGIDKQPQQVYNISRK